ncbi:MAG: hypothetical protein H7836_07395 [Magnetococcus sp. YQC-3]
MNMNPFSPYIGQEVAWAIRATRGPCTLGNGAVFVRRVQGSKQMAPERPFLHALRATCLDVAGAYPVWP